DPDRYRIVRRDDDPGVDLGRRGVLVPDGARRLLRVRPLRDPEAKNEGALCCCDHREELATIDVGRAFLEAARYRACASRLAHCRLPFFIRFAAKWIAWRMRWYVPQRHAFVTAALISASEGLGCRCSRASALMIIPDWQ